MLETVSEEKGVPEEQKEQPEVNVRFTNANMGPQMHHKTISSLILVIVF